MLRRISSLCLRAVAGPWLALACALPAAAAAPAKQPTLELVVQRVLPAGRDWPERLVPAIAAGAGDTLEYRAVYRNDTERAVRNAQVTVPVPGTGVEYLLDSAQPPADSASRDGARYAPVPLREARRDADGRVVEMPAPAAHYRFLRWNLGDVAAGASRTVRVRVLLLPVTAAR